MIHIAICDDEREFVEHMRGLLERYADETEEEIKITACYDGMELVDGIHAAGQIRRMDEKVGIIFLTTLAQYGLEGYKYQTEDYIIKPMKYVRLKAELDGNLSFHSASPGGLRTATFLQSESVATRNRPVIRASSCMGVKSNSHPAS